MHPEAQAWIDRLGLEPHPEGGFYKVTHQSALVIPREGLPACFPGPRFAFTAIYYLLTGTDFSALHRLKSDEMWHFYAGSDLSVHLIEEGGNKTDLIVGPGNFQAVVRAGTWFGSRLKHPDTFALVGCTVAPGFDFADFELANRDELTRRYPQHADLIRQLTRA